MASGTLRNLENFAFVATPNEITEAIRDNLLTLPSRGRVNIVDTSVGEGQLLQPYVGMDNAELFGIELSADRAEAAEANLPGATIVPSPMEHVRFTPGSMSLAVINPPYLTQDGRRAEYGHIRDTGNLLMPGGVLVAVIPARTAMDGTLARHLVRNYENIQVFKFPDRDDNDDPAQFQRFTQIVVIGERRAEMLKTAPETELHRLKGYRYNAKAIEKGKSPWAGGNAPAEVPTTPIAVPYEVPVAPVEPEYTVVKADEATLMQALQESGADQSEEWQQATTYPEEAATAQSVMPATGWAHMAADALTGLFDGEVVLDRYLLTTFVTQQWKPVEADEDMVADEKKKGFKVLDVQQLQDHAVLGVLDLKELTVQYFEGDEAFAFLQPLLPTLASSILEKRQPMYHLDPRDWEIDVVAGVGLDKQLPGAEHPGLATSQHHRVYAMYRALENKRQVAIQGEPGTGKTRQLTALGALFAEAWHNRSTVYQGEKQPGWIRGLSQAWKLNPNTIGERPQALPIMVVTPKRVVPVWTEEIQEAYPGAETISLSSYSDVQTWMERCAQSDAPAVFGIVSQSRSRPFRLTWEPAVNRKSETVDRPVTDEQTAETAIRDSEANEWVLPMELIGRKGLKRITDDNRDHYHRCLRLLGFDPERTLDDGSVYYAEDDRFVGTDEIEEHFTATRREIEVILDDPEASRPKVIGTVEKDTGLPITQRVEQFTFFCPDCGEQILAEPRGVKKDEDSEEDLREPVTDIEWFEKKHRTCDCCGTPLWTRARKTFSKRQAQEMQQTTFAEWSKGVNAMLGFDPNRSEREQVLNGEINGVEMPFTADACRIYPDGSLGAHLGDDFSPYEYLSWFYDGCVAATIVDESHNARAQDTDIAHSVHIGTLAAQRYVYASGTHYGGTLSDLFWYWFRFDPSFWKDLGLNWNDVARATQRYGVIQQITKEKEDTAHRDSGRDNVRSTTIPAPGISAKLIPRLLTGMVFIGVLDVGAHMPPKIELPEIVPLEDKTLATRRTAAQEAVDARRMARDEAASRLLNVQSDPDADDADVAAAEAAEAEAAEAYQEALDTSKDINTWVRERDLEGRYKDVVDTLEDMSKNRNSAAMVQKGTLPRLWSVLPCEEPNFQIWQTRTNDWGRKTGEEMVFEAPVLTQEHVYPLEQRLRELIESEQAEGRTVMVYVEQNNKRSTAKRLQRVLADYEPWTLTGKVDIEEREFEIKEAVKNGAKVLLVPYRYVAEGLNLQVIDSIVWYEMALNLFNLDQASRRIWRLGSTSEKRLYYMVYKGTVAHQKLTKLGTQSGAASLFAGDTVSGALAEQAGADKTTLARMSDSLEESLTGESAVADEDTLRDAFARRAEELREALANGRDWVGVEDTLPERLNERRATRAAATVEAEETDEAAPDVVEAPVVEVIEAEPAAVLAEQPADAPTPDTPAEQPARRERRSPERTAQVFAEWDDLREQVKVKRRSRRRTTEPAPGQLSMF